MPVRGTSSVTSWMDYINDKTGPLYGYKQDMDKTSVTKVLESLFKLEINEEETDIGGIKYNLDTCTDIYTNYLKDKISEINEDNKYQINKIKQDISKLNGSIEGASEIVNKYGIVGVIELYIPFEKITQDYAFLMGEDNFIPISKTSYYDASMLNYLTSEDNYPISYSNTDLKDVKVVAKESSRTDYEYANKYQIVILSKAKGDFLDISNFVVSVNTSVTHSGGNFSINLAFTSEDNLDNKNVYNEEIINNLGYKKAMILQGIFRENDLVFIKFEKLNREVLEEDRKIAGLDWTMIGLIDTTSINSDSTTIDISITGRDLIKLIIEDSNFFIPYQFANQQRTAFGGASSKIFKRLFSTGKYQLQFVFSLRSIESTLGFIFSQLTNMEVLTDEMYKKLIYEYADSWGKKFVYNQEGKKIERKNIEGIWGLVDFLIDEKITHYRICDSSIATPDGSIFNQINKICQMPFVEFYGDTYLNKYHFIVRRPPWDEEGMMECSCTEISPLMSISDELSFDTEVYSVFQFEPQGALFGGSGSLPLSFLPMIILDEYVKIWGNKLYHAVSNYIDWNIYSQDLENGKKNPKYNFIEDLLWLVKVMAVKPFTRKGTITIIGDRRLKIGQFIYYKKTNEIFYIESVANNAQIINGQLERTTTLGVSRGMIKDFISTKNTYKIDHDEDIGFNERIESKEKDFTPRYRGQDFKISYFNLVAIDYLRESLQNNLINLSKAYSLIRTVDNKNKRFEGTESVVVPGVFDFFLKGKQFRYSKIKKDKNKFGDTSSIVDDTGKNNIRSYIYKVKDFIS